MGINKYMKLKLHDFYKKFDATPNVQRFQVFNPTSKPMSLFVIFQQLTVVRAQKKYFEEREAHLLSIAGEEFEKLGK